MAAIALFPAGPVRGIPANAPNLTGAVIIGGGTSLAEIGYVGFGNVWIPAGNGAQIYSSSFYIVFFNLRTTGTTVLLDVLQNGGYVQNETIFISSVSSAAVTLILPNNPAWVTTYLVFDGVSEWVGSVATPISLLPNYILNVGGLDLFALVLVSFMLLNIMAGVVVARWAVRRAIWAPRFSMLVWGHVMLALLAAAVFLDYQQVDTLFAGWSPLVYPWLIFPIAFLWGLSLFNRAEVVQIQQGAKTPTGGLGYFLTEIRVGRMPVERGGRLAYVGESWWDFWARFWGHFTLAESTDQATARPWLAPVVNLLSPTASLRTRRKARKLAAKAFPNSAEALAQFPILNPDTKRRVAYIAFGKDDAPPEIKFPHLTAHRTVTLPAVYAVNPTGGAPVVLKPPREVVRLTWPHYAAPKVGEAIALEDEHYEPAAAVWAHFATVRQLGRAFAKVSHAFDVMEQAIDNRVQDEVYSIARARHALVGRTTSGISEEEAAKLAGETGTLLDPRKAVGP